MQDAEIKGCQEILHDITERQATEQERTQNLNMHTALNSILRLSLQKIPLKGILDAILHEILSMQWLSFEARGCIFLTDDDGKDVLVMTASRGFPESLRNRCAQIRFGQGICGKAAQSGAIQFSESGDCELRGDDCGFGTHCSICVPIVYMGKTVGVLNIHVSKGHVQGHYEIEFLGAAANILSGLIGRIRSNERLRVANDEIRHLITSILTILIGVSVKDRITHWNPTAHQVFEIAATDVLGRHLYELPLKWDWKIILEGIAESILQNSAVKLREMPFKRPDGDVGVLGLTINPIIGDENQLSGFLIWGADITERKMLESQLAQAQKLEAIGQLAAGVSHEINTPLQYIGDNLYFLKTSFKAFLEMLHAHTVTEKKEALVADVMASDEMAYLAEEIPRAIVESLNGVKQVVQIIKSMKELSHPGTDDKIPADLNAIIENVITVSRNQWKYVADVHTDFDGDLQAIPCFMAELNQAILAIIINAGHAIQDVVKKSGRKGLITIMTRRNGEWGEIRISDTGTGIPPSIHSKIFDPFYTTKDVGRGSGQGLAIAHSVIVKKHGGTLTFETEMGKGTTFIIRLSAN